MLRGLYTAASGMFAQQRKTDILTNNLANAQTPGFKEDQTSIRAFPEMLLHHIGQDLSGIKSTNPVGSIHTGAYLQETLPRFIQGDLNQTGIGTDMALMDVGEGTAFFTIQTGEDIQYTRNGQFTIDAEGLLTTSEGWPVLDVAGNEIRVMSDQFTVDQQGNVEENGTFIAQLAIRSTEEPFGLIKGESGLYRTDGDELLPLAENGYQVRQGFIEKSTVDPMRAMTDMLSAYRAFEANQKIVQAYDRSLEKAVNEIGRVNG